VSVLIISHTHDVHAMDVLGKLQQRGIDPVLFDTGRIPRETRLAITHDPANGWGAWAHADGRDIDLASVRSVWWRRPQPFGIDAAIGGGDDRHFVLSETHAAVSGLWSLLDATWMNEPDRDERAARKAYQLKVARESGLLIPRTCITNDPARARAFIASEGNEVIYKTFTATEATWRETRLLRPEEVEAIESVRYAPVIFQQHIRAVADLRVTVVGERLFPAAIRVPDGAYAYDFRMTMNDAAITPHELPDAVQTGLRKLMRTLGLVYGAIDLRLTPNGEYVFLEINPAGQWLFIERATGQAISEAIATKLAGWLAPGPT
jgi:glutathione synthase/RimK-type ligase-like ATP-grasp enzyme